MSDIKDHVVSRDVAEKLKGYLPNNFKSIKEWVWFKGTGWELCGTGEYRTGHHRNPVKYPAPLLTELLELFPNYEIENGDPRYYDKASREFLSCGYPVKDNLPTRVVLLYIWLVDNEYIEVER